MKVFLRWTGRRGWSVLEMVFVLLGLSVFVGIASVAYMRYQERVYVRLCHTQQRTLQGQIETLNTIDLDVPIEELFAQLIKAGLVQGTLSGGSGVDTVKFNDPGYGEGSFRDYLLMPGSKMIGCRKHGSPFADEF